MVTVTGRGLSDVARCDFGEGTYAGVPRVLGDEVRVRLYVYATARRGARDVTLTDHEGRGGTLRQGFEAR